MTNCLPGPSRCLAIVLALATRQPDALTFASIGNGSAEDPVGIIARGRKRFGLIVKERNIRVD